MNILNETPVPGKAIDHDAQQLLKDILTGLKRKMVQPVIEENKRLVAQLEELRLEQQEAARTLEARMKTLEELTRQTPMLILVALRDAIEQAGGGKQHDR